MFLVKKFFFVNHKLNYQFNMNVDQSTRAIPVICISKNVIWIFLTSRVNRALRRRNLPFFGNLAEKASCVKDKTVLFRYT